MRDKTVQEELNDAGWRVQVVWECALRGPCRKSIEDVLDLCEAFIKGEGGDFTEVVGDSRLTRGWPS